jgi:hypothetical protein
MIWSYTYYSQYLFPLKVLQTEKVVKTKKDTGFIKLVHIISSHCPFVLGPQTKVVLTAADHK